MYYILHGDDELGRSEELGKLRRRLAKGMDPTLAELNTTLIDGRSATMGGLRHACDALPFFGDRRLVIVQGLLARLSPSRRPQEQEAAAGDEPAWRTTFVKELSAYLPVLPETARLVFLESDSLPPSHPILKLAISPEEKRHAYVKEFSAPKDSQLPGWIQRRAQAKGGVVDPMAARLLAALGGDDLRLLDMEVEKLLLYAGDRPVTVPDVEALVSRARETDIFKMMDSLGQRRTDVALTMLHGLLEDGEAPLYILVMLARQVRLLIQASELRAQGIGPSEIAKRLGLQLWLTERLLDQAANWPMAQLLDAHERLLECDWTIKTGQVEEGLALDLLLLALRGK